MPLNHLQNLSHFKNSSSNGNYHGNGYNQNGFNNQYSSNSSLNSSQHYHHPYQNNSKFNSSNYNSSNNGSQQQPNMFAKNNPINKPNALVSSNQLSSNFGHQKQSGFNLNKFSEPHKFNVNAECFTSSKSKTLVEINNRNNVSNNGLKLFNENGHKSNGNRFMLNGDNLNKYSDVFDEYDKQPNSKNETNGSPKIIAPLSSCSLFNACSQIGKFSKFNNQLSTFDKLNSLDSNCLKPSNQFVSNHFVTVFCLFEFHQLSINYSSITNCIITFFLDLQQFV